MNLAQEAFWLNRACPGSGRPGPGASVSSPGPSRCRGTVTACRVVGSAVVVSRRVIDLVGIMFEPACIARVAIRRESANREPRGPATRGFTWNAGLYGSFSTGGTTVEPWRTEVSASDLNRGEARIGQRVCVWRAQGPAPDHATPAD